MSGEGRRAQHEDGRPRAAGHAAGPRRGNGARTRHERKRVVEAQRARILAAAKELTRELGAERVTVAHIVRQAGVSRRTFYELFSDRESCFLAVLDQAIEQVASEVVPAYEGESDWVDRIRAAMTAMLECFERHPDVAGLCVIDALGGGVAALTRRARTVDVLVRAVDEGRGAGAHAGGAGRFSAEAAVGAVLAILHERLREDSSYSLIGLRGQLMSVIVLPYLGPEAAAAELALKPQRVRREAQQGDDPLRGLDMRLTYRTLRVLASIAISPGANNRQIAREAGVADQGQISKLLQRLERLGLIHNSSSGLTRGEANAWALTVRGEQLEQAVRARSGG